MNREEKLRLLLLGDKADARQDDLINVLIEVAQSRFSLVYNNLRKGAGLEIALNTPPELDWITDEVVIKRFNRIGSEGYNTQSIEGHAVSFEDDDFKEFMSLIGDFIATAENQKPRAGRMVIY